MAGLFGRGPLARLGRLAEHRVAGAGLAHEGALGSLRQLSAAGGVRSDFDVLGVSPSASKEEIKKAYRREALKWHPDRHSGSSTKAEAEAKFKRISEAYSNLSSGRGRSSSPGSTSSGGGRPRYQPRRGRSGGGGATYQYEYRYPNQGGFSRGDADKIFEEIFGSGAAQQILREMEQMFRHQQQRGTYTYRGGFGDWGRGMSPEEFRRIFEQQETSRSRRRDGSGVITETKRETFTNHAGKTFERVTTTTKDGAGRVLSRTVEETQAPWASDGGRSGVRGGRDQSVDQRQQSQLAAMVSSLFTQVFVRVFVPLIVKTVTNVVKAIFFGNRRIK